ncbi:MAG: response regulator transcription factor [Ardenticatenales bacterium]|nr:response regulator transcription factor [Ardenticatenales bacterium]
MSDVGICSVRSQGDQPWLRTVVRMTSHAQPSASSPWPSIHRAVATPGLVTMSVATEPIVVLILEDGLLLRQRLVELIRTVDGIDVVLEAGDAPTAVALARQHKPQVVVLDIRVPGDATMRNGLDVLREIKRFAPLTGAIVLTNLSSAPYAHQANHLGADAFLDKSTELDELLPTIESLVAQWRDRGSSIVG